MLWRWREKNIWWIILPEKLDLGLWQRIYEKTQKTHIFSMLMFSGHFNGVTLNFPMTGAYSFYTGQWLPDLTTSLSSFLTLQQGNHTGNPSRSFHCFLRYLPLTCAAWPGVNVNICTSRSKTQVTAQQDGGCGGREGGGTNGRLAVCQAPKDALPAGEEGAGHLSAGGWRHALLTDPYWPAWFLRSISARLRPALFQFHG